MTDPVHTQYEALPYPARDPRDEAKRLIVGSPSALFELNHYVFGGARDFSRPFRALVAGGGTGDAAIMLAQQLADIGAAAEIVYLDWSAAARKVAEARAAVRRLANLRFVTGSLLEPDSLDLGRFDYIDCCGVLHHLPDPDAGLDALVRHLADDGGMGVMLYAWLGRTGVYPMQDMLRALLDGSDDVAARLAVARKLLGQLPQTNWFKRNPFMADHIEGGDAGLFDLLLHARDRAYDVRQVHDFVARAGLRLVSFVPSVRYRPESYVSDATLLKRLDRLPAVDRAAFAENLIGNMKLHAFYVVKRANAVAPPAADDPTSIPIFCGVEPDLAKSIKPDDRLTTNFDGWKARLPLPPLAGAIAGLVDGQRDLAAIHRTLQARRADLGWDDFAAQFGVFYAAFNGISRLMLRRPAR